MEIAAQVVGYVATAVTLISLQQKKIINIFIFAIIANALASVSNLLIGGYAGAGSCAVAVVQTTVSLIFEIKHKKVPLPLTLGFIACYIAVSAVTFRGPLDVLPCVAALLYALAVTQKKPFYYRIFMALNSVAWIVYELTLSPANYAMAVTFSVQLIATIVGMIRLDFRKKEKEDNGKEDEKTNGDEGNAENGVS